MALDPLPILASFAAVIGLGFVGYLLFERTRVTDVLILIALGYVIGHLLGVFDVESFKQASPLVGTLALIVIMFDGGLGLNLRDLLAGIARSTILALAGFLLTTLALASVAHYWIHLDWLTSLLLGGILGGSSGIIIMPIIARTTAHNATRVVLTVESALTDVLCVITAVTLMGLLVGASGGVDAGEFGGAGRTVVAQFSVAAVFGLVAGLAWLRVLRALEGKKYSYMITLAAVLALYTGAEAFGGNGAIGVLLFGTVLGNGYLIAERFQFRGVEFSDRQIQFQGEIAFLVRAFFFVYLGVILDTSLFAQPMFLLTSLLLFLAAMLARALAVAVATWRDPDTREDRVLMSLMGPRGLAAAVLAGLPAAAGIPGTEDFLGYAFALIVATNLVGTLAVFGYEAKKRRTVRLGVTVPAQSGKPPQARRP